MHPLSRILAAVAAVAVAAVPAGISVATAAAKQKPRPNACKRLKAHHRDLSPHERLVLVRRGSDETGDVSACLLPRGKVRRLASWDDGLGRESAGVEETAGTWVLVAYHWGDQYGGTVRSLRRIDVRTGRQKLLTAYGCQLSGPSSCPSGTSYGKVVLAPEGAAVLESSDLATGVTSLLAFAPDGSETRLDDGRVDSLSLAGDEIVWTRAGQEHRAPLPR